MRRALALPCTAEAAASEHELLCPETRPLQAATGFVIGSALSGMVWMLAGLFVWCLTQ